MDTRLLDSALKIEAAKRANGDPLPGPLEAALDPESIVVGEIKVRPVVPGDWIILKKLDSPLYRLQIEEKKDDVTISEEESVEIIYQFTRPPKEVRQVLTQGRQYFRETALDTISDKFSISQMLEVSRAVNEQLRRYYETIIKYGQAEEGKKLEVNFPEQPTSA